MLSRSLILAGKIDRTTGRYEEFDVKAKDSNEPANDRSPSSIWEVDRPPLRHIDRYIDPECPCFSKRLTVAFLTCLGFIVMFGMRCNMTLARLALKKIDGNTTVSSVDSSIFWGYLVTQVPGGFLATKYPANRLFGGAIVISCVLNLFLPTLIEAPHVLMCIRFLQGLVEGVTYPSCHGIWTYWAPPFERSKLTTLAFCGCYAGVLLGLRIGGVLVGHSGWKSPFYFYGFIGVTWYLFWIWLVFEKPNKHPTIETRELHYIQSSLGENPNTAAPTTFASIPWKSFFTSLPVWAIFVANFCRSWNFYLLVLFQASFVRDVYSIEIEENAVLDTLPHLLMTIIVPTGGVLADYLRKKDMLTTTQVRKLFNCGGFGMEATFFLVVAFSQTLPVALIAQIIGVAFSGFAISGFNVNHLDIAPKYASILMGLSNGIGTIAGCICPLVVYKMTDGVTNLKEKSDHWSYVFILAACVHFFGVAFYAIFASGELQPWAIHEQSHWNPTDETVQPTMQSNCLLQTKMPGNPVDGSGEHTVPSMATNVGQPMFPPPAYPPRTSPPVTTEAPVVHPANPFLSGSNQFRSESVEPQTEDIYFHGAIDDRTY